MSLGKIWGRKIFSSINIWKKVCNRFQILSKKIPEIPQKSAWDSCWRRIWLSRKNSFDKVFSETKNATCFKIISDFGREKIKNRVFFEQFAAWLSKLHSTFSWVKTLWDFPPSKNINLCLAWILSEESRKKWPKYLDMVVAPYSTETVWTFLSCKNSINIESFDDFVSKNVRPLKKNKSGKDSQNWFLRVFRIFEEKTFCEKKKWKKFIFFEIWARKSSTPGKKKVGMVVWKRDYFLLFQRMFLRKNVLLNKISIFLHFCYFIEKQTKFGQDTFVNTVFYGGSWTLCFVESRLVFFGYSE